MTKASGKKPHPAAAACEIGDHVFAEHPEHGPMAVRIISKGVDGFHGRADDGTRHPLGWDSVRGHKARKLERYTVVDRGADGALLQDDRGRRRFIAGEVPDTPAPKPAPKPDDPLTGGLARLSKASAMMLPDGPILLFKAATIANRPGLTLTKVTDHGGHTTQRWKRSNPDQGKERREPRLDASKPAPLQRATPDVRANPADRWKISDPKAPAAPAGPRREPTLPKPSTTPAKGKGAEPRALLPVKPGQTLQPKGDSRALQEQVLEGDVPPPDAPLTAEGQAASRPVEGDGAEPIKHGETVTFQHGNVQGQGKIVASGVDGVTVHDGEREHQVRHENLGGKAAALEVAAPDEKAVATNRESGGGQPPGDTAASETTGMVSGFKDMGQAIGANLRDMLWRKMEAGETTELGKPSAVLVAARAAMDAGQISDRAGFDRFITEFYEGLKAATKAGQKPTPSRPRRSAANGKRGGKAPEGVGTLVKSLPDEGVLLLFKAQTSDGTSRDMFAVPVQVKGHTTKGGVIVKPHTAIRHKAEAPSDHVERHAAGHAAYKEAYTAAPGRSIDEKLARLEERRDPDGQAAAAGPDLEAPPDPSPLGPVEPVASLADPGWKPAA